MANLRDIKRRIKSVKNTRQITKAMQLVAASKMKKAQDQAIAGIPYAVYLADILNVLSEQVEDMEHPFFEDRPLKKRGILVVSTDRGLCGPLNSNLFRFLTQNQEKGNCRYYAVGRKAVQFLSRTGRELAADFEVAEHVTFRSIRILVESMINDYKSGAIDTIEVLYPRFVNTLIQEPEVAKLVPLTGLDELVKKFHAMRERNTQIPEELPDDGREMKFEPSVEAILAELPLLFVKQEIYQMILSAKASEHSARMVAMKSATDNASNLIDDLTLEYNKARQAAITQEVLEIAAAAGMETK